MMQRTHKVKNSYGLADYYTAYKKDGGTITSQKFSKVTKRINKLIGEAILDGYIYTLPRGMGFLGITKRKAYIKEDKEGNIYTNRPIDFNATNKLWAANPEAKGKKILLRHANRHSNGFVYKFKYYKSKAKYENRKIYMLQVNREITRALTPKILKGFDVDKMVKKL